MLYPLVAGPTNPTFKGGATATRTVDEKADTWFRRMAIAGIYYLVGHFL